MQNTFLAIVGPTAVGKSDFALLKAQELQAAGASGVDIISVDSKQVYTGLEILTGADIPATYRVVEAAHTPPSYRALPRFFVSPDGRTFLHGISIIQPHEEWSVTHFQTLAQRILTAAAQADRTVLFVGGTGLYYAQLFSTDDRLRVGPNLELRARAAAMSIEQLQAEAEHHAASAYAQLNNSDRQNPRRLIRVIEKAVGTPSPSTAELNTGTLQYLGLRADLPTLQSRITLRVEKRLAGGAVDEVMRVQKLLPAPTSQALATLGVAELTAFGLGKITRDECAQLWALHEFQYAKHQFTWWKKQPVEWYDATNKNLLYSVQ